MQPFYNIAKICLLFSLGSLGACSTMSERQETDSTKSVKVEQIPTVDQTIIQDLAGVIAQIYDPLSTTLQINATESDPTLNYFVSVLAEKGFGIQRVSADQGANFVAYTRTKETLDNKAHINFSVAVGAVNVARKYQLMRNNVVAPASTVRLSGTRASVAVNDTASNRMIVNDPSLSKAQYVASLSLDAQAPMISLITPEIVNNIAAQSADGPSLQALNSSKIEVNNLFYASQSTFSSLLDDYSKIYKYVVVFGNDSMVLGKTNKSLIDQLVENVLQENDIVNLVGCSNGPTALEIGNEGLALGRAGRVTDALMARGVARQNILDEGCWAPVAEEQDRFPSRGVVLELWRRNA
ncbi:hypothetical protein N9850_12405 [Granulosicoccus sp.]|nr:hypothetical protein [Granulosicoccus sp.]MDB4224565.1 hypothetical protein [Granulosicoccus sp.]